MAEPACVLVRDGMGQFMCQHRCRIVGRVVCPQPDHFLMEAAATFFQPVREALDLIAEIFSYK